MDIKEESIDDRISIVFRSYGEDDCRPGFHLAAALQSPELSYRIKDASHSSSFSIISEGDFHIASSEFMRDNSYEGVAVKDGRNALYGLLFFDDSSHAFALDPHSDVTIRRVMKAMRGLKMRFASHDHALKANDNPVLLEHGDVLTFNDCGVELTFSYKANESFWEKGLVERFVRDPAALEMIGARHKRFGQSVMDLGAVRDDDAQEHQESPAKSAPLIWASMDDLLPRADAIPEGKSFAELMDHGQDLYDDGKYASAAVMWSVAALSDPKSPLPYIKMADALVNNGNFTAAIMAISRAVSLGCGSAYAASEMEIHAKRIIELNPSGHANSVYVTRSGSRYLVLPGDNKAQADSWDRQVDMPEGRIFERDRGIDNRIETLAGIPAMRQISEHMDALLSSYAKDGRKKTEGELLHDKYAAQDMLYLHGEKPAQGVYLVALYPNEVVKQLNVPGIKTSRIVRKIDVTPDQIKRYLADIVS